MSRIFSLFTILCLMTVTVLSQQIFHGQPYQSQSGSQKASEISKAVSSDTTMGGFYSTLQQAEFLIEPMTTTFTTSADQLPKNYHGLEQRKKLIHTVGVVGAINWVPVPNRLNYTGVFATGTKNGFLRMSSTGQPEINGTIIENQYTPGLAFKFLRDGVPAASLFALHKLGSEENNNFFAHDFTNHPPDVPFSAPIAAQILRSTFAKASKFPASLGLSSIAEYDDTGKKVAAPHFPWRLIVHPVAAVHSLLPEVYPGAPYWVQLPKALTPGPMFEIYAIDDPKDDANVKSAVLIAQINLLTPVSTSMFGDKSLYFQHWSLESDLAYRPEWTTAAQQISLQQRKSNVTLFYPDLPWA